MNKLYQGDCIKIMSSLPEDCVDMVFCDLPYGTTQNSWDSPIPFDELWSQYRRIVKENGAIVLTAQPPFDKVLACSNLKEFKYEWIWEKNKATGHLNAKKMPMKAHENILVFYRKLPTYNPQMTIGKPYDKGTAVRDAEQYGKQTKAVHVKNTEGTRYPRSVLYFKTAEDEGKLHPTQKPIALYEYLIRTYSNEGDVWEKSKTNVSNYTLTIEFRGPFKPRRGRINCSLNDNGKWRWFGVQFPIQEN